MRLWFHSMICFVLFSYEIESILAFALDPSWQHHHHPVHSNSLFKSNTDTTNKSSKCPFTAFKDVFGLNKLKQNKSDPLHETQKIDIKEDDQSQYFNRIPSSTVARVAMVATIPNSGGLTPLESWCIMNVESMYSEALSWKCPFLRRRATDMLDLTDTIMRLFLIRNKELVGPPPSLRCSGKSCIKSFGLSKEELMEIIRKDWKVETQRGYYVTGRLSTNIYRDDCIFDGPDPDLPIRGLRKYMNAACQLFDQRTTRSVLLDLFIDNDVIKAKWKFTGTLRLPWHPSMPEVTGTTTYYFDPTGLIYKHEDTWDLSAFQAFSQTFFPKLSRIVWPVKSEKTSSSVMYNNDNDDNEIDDYSLDENNMDCSVY